MLRLAKLRPIPNSFIFRQSGAVDILAIELIRGFSRDGRNEALVVLMGSRVDGNGEITIGPDCNQGLYF